MILIATPAPPRARTGNRVTALRWARILRGLGHRVEIARAFERQRCDALVALHASKSFESIERFARRHPERPLIVALTGTDLYRDLRTHHNARQGLEWASRLIVLQRDALPELPEHLHSRTRVIYQSVRPPPGVYRARSDVFEVCVIGHLRAVKDPFRTAMATRRLPAGSRVRVIHIGAALEPRMEDRAVAERTRNPRYKWLGALPRWRVLRRLARCRLLSLTSRLEGGANVVSEAVACGTPVVSSRISGSLGLLGADYPGYFPVGDTKALTELLARSEGDPAFYATLVDRCAELRPLIDPRRERRSWQELLTELGL